MYWKKKRIEYEILIPPLNKPFMELSSNETKAFFEWYMGQIPKRISYLSQYCTMQMDINISEMNLSPESLIPIWHWFLTIAQTERTPQKQLKSLVETYKTCPTDLRNYMLNESKEQFSLQTEFILRDIGMYIGAVFLKNNPSIYWGYYENPKTDFYVNTPLLLGFADSSFTPPFKMTFEPIHMVGVQAANIWDNTHTDKDLYYLYEKWLKYVPNEISSNTNN